jgi:hypothetical protein
MLKKTLTFLALSAAAVGLAASPAAAAGGSLKLNDRAYLVPGGVDVVGKITCASGEEERDITVTVAQGSVVGTGHGEYYCNESPGNFEVFVPGNFHTGTARASASSPRTSASNSKNLRDQRDVEIVYGIG